MKIVKRLIHAEEANNLWNLLPLSFGILVLILEQELVRFNGWEAREGEEKRQGVA